MQVIEVTVTPPPPIEITVAPPTPLQVTVATTGLHGPQVTHGDAGVGSLLFLHLNYT